MYDPMRRRGDSYRPPSEEAELTPDARGARWLRRRIAGGVAVVATVVDGIYRGATVTGAMVAATEPLTMILSLEGESQMADWLETSGAFGFSILPWREQPLADRFAGFAPLAHHTFRDIPHVLGPTGSPLLRGAIAWVDCHIASQFAVGDHRLFTGEALAIAAGEGAEDDPLVYYLNRYRRIEERP